MTEDEIKKQKSEAVAELEDWVNVTGAVPRESLWYSEIQSMIEDAVDRGAGTFKPEPWQRVGGG
jgi:hypothetical protein